MFPGHLNENIQVIIISNVGQNKNSGSSYPVQLRDVPKVIISNIAMIHQKTGENELDGTQMNPCWLFNGSNVPVA